MIMSVVAAVAVDHTSFIAKSRASLEALKSANLLKSLNLNALIVGEDGTGKITLAKYILPKAEIVDGSSLREILSLLTTSKAIIIRNFDKISACQRFNMAMKDSSARVIATSKNEFLDELGGECFSLKITILPLSERLEDVELLVNKFLKEASDIFGDNIRRDDFFKNLNVDLSNNCHSLKKSVYAHYFTSSLDEKGLMQIMEEYLSKQIGGKNDYRDQLYLFDVPMIRCGFKKFNSQLQISEKFGLNRNTLRKKINDYKDKYRLQ